MATGVQKKVGYSLVKVGDLTLENTNDFSWYQGIVACGDKIIVIDRYPYQVRLHRLQDGKLLCTHQLEPTPRAICVINDMEIGVILDEGQIQIMAVESRDNMATITSTRNLQVQGGIDRYDGVVKFKENLVVCGVKQETMSWCVVSLNDGRVDTIHQICKVSKYYDYNSYLTTKDNMIYISCRAGFDSPDNGVYGFDILNPSQPKYTYKHEDLYEPGPIAINQYGFIFVCYIGLNSYIHQLTSQCQLVSIYSQGIPRNLTAIFWDHPHGHLYVTCYESKVMTIFQPEYTGVPIEILNMDDRSIQLFEEALKAGKENVYNIRVMVVGHLGVGKTTLIKRLLGEEVDISERHSTEGVDVHVNCCDVSLSTHKWTRREKDSEQDHRLQRLAKVLIDQQSTRDQAIDEEQAAILPQGMRTDSSAGVTDEEQVVIPPEEDRTLNSHIEAYVAVEDKDTEALYTGSHSPPQEFGQIIASTASQEKEPTSASVQRTLTQSETSTKAMLKLLQEKAAKLQQDAGKYAPLTMWDFAGQYAFYTTHQTFLTRRAIYLLVSDVSGQVTDLVDDEYYFDSEGIMKCKVHELIGVWLNSIHSCAPSPEDGIPPVILVGTHVDKISQKQLPAKGIESETQIMTSDTVELTLPTTSTPAAAASKEQSRASATIWSMQSIAGKSSAEPEHPDYVPSVFDFTMAPKPTPQESHYESISGSRLALAPIAEDVTENTPSDDRDIAANALLNLGYDLPEFQEIDLYTEVVIEDEWNNKDSEDWESSYTEDEWDTEDIEAEKYRHEICERYFREIRSYLRDKPTRFHLVDEDFAIDNTIVDRRLKDLKRKIVEVVSRQPYWGEEIPARWIPLEQELMKLKAAGIKVILRSLLENLNEAAAVQISTDELDLFLRFQHDIGTIIYFSSEVLKMKIVLDPQWMIDALKSLITAEMFVLRNAPTFSNKWFEFREDGKLSPELIDAIWAKENNPDLHDNREHILLLMEQMNIIARPKLYAEDAEDALEIKEENYFLAPCMLRQKTPQDVICPKLSDQMESSSVLCYVFTGKFLPSPIFHRLLAACVAHWPLATKKREEMQENLIFCGCAVFQLDHYHKLILHFRDYVIFLRVIKMGIRDKTPSSKVCIEVREFITTMLSRIIGYLSTSLSYEHFIQCPEYNGDSVNSLIAVSLFKENAEVRCDFHDNILESWSLLKFWFKDQEQSGDGDACKTQGAVKPIEEATDGQNKRLNDNQDGPASKRIHSQQQGTLGSTSTDSVIADKSTEAKKKHNQLCCILDGLITKDSLRNIKRMARTYLDPKILEKVESMDDILSALEDKGKIGVGNYDILKEIMTCAGVGIGVDEIHKTAKDIKDIMESSIPSQE